MDSELGNGIGENVSRTDSESTREAVTPNGTENYESPLSAASSSSESDSSVTDLFQLDPLIASDSNDSDPKSSSKSDDNEKTHRRDIKSDVAIAALLSLEKIYGSSGSISQVSDVTHESTVPSLSQTHSPPVQMMERSEGYDPNRIPASAFTSKASTPMEWSATSNDSLFSIQIGHSLARLDELNVPNESFKWKDSKKSADLNGPNSFSSPGVVKISDHVVVLGQNSPLTKEKEEKQKTLDLGQNRVGFTDKVKNIPYKSVKFEDKANEEGYKNDQNGTNIRSSGFPRKRKSSKLYCLCSNCSWGCCFGCCSKRPRWSCKWLCLVSLCCKWPSCSGCCVKCHCSNCSWAFCCNWKATNCCCFKILNDGRAKKWCSCCCCCPCSCCCACCSSCSYSCC